MGCFLGLLKVAYSDPKFYLEYINKKLTYFSYTSLVASGFLWLGIYSTRGYVVDNIDLISEQLAVLDKGYNHIISYLLVVIIASILSFVGSLLFIDIARKKVSSS
jgi:hypothetical protein